MAYGIRVPRSAAMRRVARKSPIRCGSSGRRPVSGPRRRSRGGDGDSAVGLHRRGGRQGDRDADPHPPRDGGAGPRRAGARTRSRRRGVPSGGVRAASGRHRAARVAGRRPGSGRVCGRSRLARLRRPRVGVLQCGRFAAAPAEHSARVFRHGRGLAEVAAQRRPGAHRRARDVARRRTGPAPGRDLSVGVPCRRGERAERRGVAGAERRFAGAGVDVRGKAAAQHAGPLRRLRIWRCPAEIVS